MSRPVPWLDGMTRSSSWFKRKAARSSSGMGKLSSPSARFPPAKDTENAWSEGSHPELLGSRLSGTTGVASPDVGTTTADSPDHDLDPDTPSSLDIPDADAAGGGCEPSVERLRAMLSEADRTHSDDSFADGSEEEDGDIEEQYQCRRRQQQQQQPKQSDGDISARSQQLQTGFRSRRSRGGEGGGGGRSTRPPFFADDGAPASPSRAAARSSTGEGQPTSFSSEVEKEEEDEQGIAAEDRVGAVAVAAAVEAVLLCPPQVLARTSLTNSPLALSSLLQGSVRGPRRILGFADEWEKTEAGPQEEKEEEEDEGDEAAVAAAVAAALAWKPPVPRLEMVAEEGGGYSTDDCAGATDVTELDKFAAARSSSLHVERRLGVASTQPLRHADAKGGGGGGRCSVDDISVKAKTVTGEEMAWGETTAQREARASSSPPLPPSPSGSGLLASGSSCAEKSPMGEAGVGSAVGGGGALVGGDGSGLDVVGGGGEVRPGVAAAPRRCYHGSESLPEHRHSSSAAAGVSFPSSQQRRACIASVSPASTVGGKLVGGDDYRRRVGCRSLSVCSRRPHDTAADFFDTALAEAEVEAADAGGVFGRAPVGTDTAMVGPTARIAALPTAELARLSEIDRLSDSDGYGSSSGVLNTSGVSPKICNVLDTSALASQYRSSPPLVRVGANALSGGGDGGGTTPYRFRRLAGVVRGWPAGVNPTRREEWLAPAEFDAVFGVTFDAFRKLPSWRKIILKQEVGLF